MGKASPRHFPPPLKGIEWRDVFQDSEGEAITAECMINLETSHGELRERNGFEHIISCPNHAQIHVTDHPSKYKRIITVGELPDGLLYAYVYNTGTGDLKTTNLSGLTNEKWFPGFRCSFVPVRLPGGPNLAFDSTLIVTPSFTYCVLVDGSVRVSDMTKSVDGGDCLRINDRNYSYIQSQLRGPIAVEHADKVFYMGWGTGTQFQFTSPVEEVQVLIPGVVIDQDRGSYRLSGDWMVYSDDFSSLDVQAHHALRTENREEITGAASFRDVLVIFTDVSTYVLLGASDKDFQMRKVDSGVGCVSHWSIVEANGLLYWMAKDGIYSFNGSKVEKVSQGIDQLWSDETRSAYVPGRFAPTARDIGWPWTASRSALGLVNSVHFAERSLLLWSMPIMNRKLSTHRGGNTLPVTLVYDYKHGGFYFWVAQDHEVSGQDVPGTCMYDGATLIDRGKETLYVTNHGLYSAGGIARYGEYMDMPAPNVDVGIPLIWTTGRIDKNVMGTARIQSTRFSVRSRGDYIAGSSDLLWSVYDATTQHQTDLSDHYGSLYLYPRELLEDETMTGEASPLLDTGEVGSMKLGAKEYFKAKGGGCRSTDGSLRVSLFSLGGDIDVNLRMNGWAFEIERGDTR
jgi:hypothetical protein